jgi:integrase
MALTKTRLRALKPGNRRYEVADSEGLCIEVLPSGRMSWRYRYRLAGRREKLTIGPYPALSLREARERRFEAEKAVVFGQSPARAKQERKRAARRAMEAPLVSDLVAPWVETVLRPTSRSAWQDETYLARDVLPRIGRLRPEDVTTADIWACVEAVRQRGHGQAARRVRNVIRRLFEYAQSQGLVRGNPAQPVRPAHIAPARSRRRTLTTEELARWLAMLYAANLSRSHVLTLHFLLLVPVRKGELIRARWRDFDLESGVWDIPASRSKNGVPIRHGLSRQAHALLCELHELANGSEWVLPSSRRGGREPISASTLNLAIATLPQWPKGLLIHDLRRTVRTQLSEMGGVPSEVAELCLNHRPKGIHGVYDRAERLAERAVALQRWADRLDGLCAAARPDGGSARDSLAAPVPTSGPTGEGGRESGLGIV